MATQQVQQGWGQQTPAVQQIIRAGIGAARSIARATRSRKRTASSSRATSRKRKKRATASKGRSATSRKKKRATSLVKGSAAAKAWGRKMARLRGK